MTAAETDVLNLLTPPVPTLATWIAVGSLPPDGPFDYSAIISFGQWAFGLVAFRSRTFLVFGHDSLWLNIPSWLAAILVLLLGLFEWFALRSIPEGVRWLRRFASQRFAPSEPPKKS